MIRKLICVLIAVMCLCTNAFADAKSTASTIISQASEPTINSIGGEWAVIGVARSGVSAEEYFKKYYNNAESAIKECKGVLSERKYTEYSRVVMAMTAIGKNPQDIAGYDLTAKLLEYDNVTKQGINGSIFALIALDCGDYYSDKTDIRDKYIENIISKQHSDGGFGMGEKSEVDVSAMALQALANYRQREDINKCVESALKYIEGINEFGTSEEISQVAIAYATLGIDAEDMINRLTQYSSSNGYEHIKGGGYNQMATEQGLIALCAYDRYKNGEKAVYDMTEEKEENTNSKFDEILKALGFI